MRTYVLLAVVATVGPAAGYDGPQLTTYVWAGQGLIGVVLFWGWTELADRIRTGEIVSDLLRPVHPVSSYLAADLGRGAFAVLTRFIFPMLLGALAFDLYEPQRLTTYPLFAVSTALAVVICFGCRFLINSTAYWLLDIRGVQVTWTLMSGLLCGLYFPLRFLPEPAYVALWVATPFPSILQAPVDVLVERDPRPTQLGLVAVQVVWAFVMIWLCRAVQRRAERKLVIQGG